MSTVRVGLIGLGRAGWGMLTKDLRQRQQQFQIVAGCDLLADRTEKLADEFGSAAYSDYHELLRDPNFVLPPPGSDISIEEALHLGGSVLMEAERKAKEKKAGHERKKTKHKLENIYRDDEL